MVIKQIHKMQYSPKLKKAMEEIKIILDKHDIAAAIVLHTPGNSEFYIKINPTYSCARIVNDRFKIFGKLEYYAFDKDKRDKAVTNTSNMLAMLSETTGKLSLQLFQLSDMITEATGSEHTDNGFTAHSTQNN